MAKVRKIIQANVPTLNKNASVMDAARLLSKSDKGCAVILENNAPIGIVTELDILRGIAKGSLSGNVGKIMTSQVSFMTPDMKLDEALKTVDTKKFRKYPVVEGSKLVGLVTKKDIVNEISDNLRLHRNIQNFVLVIFVLFEFFVFVLYRPISQFLNIGV